MCQLFLRRLKRMSWSRKNNGFQLLICKSWEVTSHGPDYIWQVKSTNGFSYLLSVCQCVRCYCDWFNHKELMYLLSFSYVKPHSPSLFLNVKIISNPNPCCLLLLFSFQRMLSISITSYHSNTMYPCLCIFTTTLRTQSEEGHTVSCSLRNLKQLINGLD